MRLVFLVIAVTLAAASAQERRVGALQEVFAWKQLTYNIDGVPVTADRFADFDADQTNRFKRQSDRVSFNDNLNENTQGAYNTRPHHSQRPRPIPSTDPRPGLATSRPTIATSRPTEGSSLPDSEKFFIQYNNVPMGVERHGNILFVTVPRRRYGIPSTLNYLDLDADSTNRSPSLRPYPNLRESRSLVSVYRTRVDRCGRLWMVDTGLMEIPDNRQQRQPPSIVVYDLNTNTRILKYEFKDTDLVSANTPAGLASITIDFRGGCGDAFAYVPDLATYGLIVFSLRELNSWRVSHNYFSFLPNAGDLNIAGQKFQWNDGIFSITLAGPHLDGWNVAMFHPMASTQEFSISTRILQNRTLATRSYHGDDFKMVGDRGPNSQSTMHGYHATTGVVFYANIGRDAVTCWNTRIPLNPDAMVTLAQDHEKLVYPADLHVTGDEVWVMANTMPRFIYSSLDTNQYNFFIYKGTVKDMISGTTCGLKNAEEVNFPGQ